MGLLRAPSGTIVNVPDDQVGSARASGYEPVGAEEAGATTGAIQQEDTGALGGAAALGTGLLSGLTVGASDPILGSFLTGGERAGLAAAREQHPISTVAGEIGGALLPAIFTGGATAGESTAGIGARILQGSPAAAVSRVGRAVTGSIADEGAGLLVRTAGATAGAAAEGALYGGGQYLSQVALEDKPLSAEGFVGGMGKGALFAAPVGGGLHLGGEALIRAKALFPHQQVTHAAAQGIQKEATSTLAQAVTDSDAMAAAATRKMAEADAQAGVAQAGENVTRRMFGAADPQALADQASTMVDKAVIAEALQAQQAAKAQLVDWIRAEADPSLEAALSGLEVPGVQTGATAGVPVPRGEFGAPGARGIKTPAELELAAAGPGTPPGMPALDATGPGGPRALRGGRGEVPAESPASGEIPEATADRIEVKKVGNWRERKMEVVEYRNGIAGEPRVVSQDEAYEIAKKATPAGFTGHLLDSRKDFTIASGIPKTPGEIVDNALYVVKPSELAERGVLGNKIRPDDLKRGAEGFADASVKFPTVEIDMAPNGEMWVMDGNHRLQNAASTDRPMAVKFRKVSGTRAEEAAAGRTAKGTGDPDVDISQRIRDALPSGTQAPAATDTLTGQMRAMQSALGEGRSLGELSSGSPARAEYVASKEAKTSEAAAHFRAKANAKNYAGSDMAAAERSAQPPSEIDRFFADLQRPKMRDAYVAQNIGRAMREEGSHAAALGKVEREWAERAAQPGRADVSETFSVKHRHLGDTQLNLSTETRTLGSGGNPRTFVKVTRELSDGTSVPVATAEFSHRAEGLYPEHVVVDQPWQRQGIGTRIYEAAEKSTGRRLIPSADQTTEGAAFSAKYRSGRQPARGDATQAFRLEDAKLRFEPGSRTYHPVEGGQLPSTPVAEMNVGLRPRAEPEGIAAAEKMAPGAGPAGKQDLMALFGLEGDAAALPSKAEIAGLKGTLEEHGLGRGAAVTEVDHGMGERIAEHENIGKTIVDSEMRGRMRGVVDEDAIDRALAKHHGKNVDIGPNIAKAAKAIGDFEAANATLVDILGPEAPVSAATQAKVYRAAAKAQAEASAASSAKASSDIAGKAPTAAAAPGGSLLNTAANIGGALEVLHALGVHTPALSAIPVIGPVLGLILKARAVMGVLGRKGGSIGASAEGKIAEKAAETRNRINAATSAILEGAGKGTRKASAFAAAPAVLLGHRLFPGNGVTDSKDPQRLLAARMDEISRALAPSAIDHAIGDRYQTSDPALHDAVVAQVERGMKFLDSKAPKPMVPPGMLPGDGPPHVSRAAIAEFAKYVHAVSDPASVLEDLAGGHVTLEGAETLRVVYPALFAEAQQMLLQAAPKMQITLSYAKRVAISIMYQVPVDVTMTPGHMQFLRPVPSGGGPTGGGSGPASPPPGAPAMTGPIQIGKQTISPLDARGAMP